MAGRRRRPGVLSRFLKLLYPGILERGRDKKKTNGATLKRAASANRFHCFTRIRLVGPLFAIPLKLLGNARLRSPRKKVSGLLAEVFLFWDSSSSYSRLCFSVFLGKACTPWERGAWELRSEFRSWTSSAWKTRRKASGKALVASAKVVGVSSKLRASLSRRRDRGGVGSEGGARFV